MNNPSRHSTYVALLRAINVGGRNRLSMDELARMFKDAGCVSVRTYIQSGNVVFVATPAVSLRAREIVAATVSDRLGTQIPVILRSVSELTEVVGANPFPNESPESGILHVGFLADRPSLKLVSSLDPNRSPPDEFAVRDREIYLRLPNGMARTRLTTGYIERTLATRGTFRNWKTLLYLLKAASG